MQALQRIAVINGRPTIWGDAALALVRASRLLESIKEEVDGEGDAMVATCTVMRVGDLETVSRTFSVADAKTAGLWNKRGSSGQPTPWITHPKRMLQMRARAFALRDVFPDVMGGMYIAEEVVDDRDDAPRAAQIEPPTPDDPPPNGGAPADVDPPAPPADAKSEPEAEPATRPAAETAKVETVDPATGEITWEDPADAAADVDPPAPTEAKPTVDATEDPKSGLPACLDRSKGAAKKSDKPKPISLKDQAAWLDDCRAAAEGADSMVDLGVAQTRLLAPYRDRVPPQIVAQAEMFFDARMEALEREAEAENDKLDPEQWLRDLDGALAGCEAAEQLGDVKEKVLLPAKSQVPDAAWKDGVARYRAKLNSFMTNLDAG
ncbi:recombinase RecT [Xanthobacteraceae bacterium Astr-EGSB]|uniref:recombinase RecT n=1 Tax=Astrobacterium formosum TaxID=3069710 RepID=UPI0027B4256B|nr:recombinase RecT [Xanthobacteraceae bacterium Astr-EGSB]